MTTKKCARCQRVKFLDEFSKATSRTDGLHIYCKLCDQQRSKETYQRTKEQVNERSRNRYQRDKEKILARNRRGYIQHRGEWLAQRRQYRAEHKEEAKKQRQQSRITDRVRDRKYQQHRRKTDSLFRITSSLRTRLNNALKATSFRKTSKLFQYLGCTLEELKVHLEKQFKEGMTWDNYGPYRDNGYTTWQMDHIIPLSSATTEEELYKLCHYTNLQPLWAATNREKSDKV